MYNKVTATVAFILLFVGFNVTYFPMLILGIQGMPRRYHDYLPEFHGLNMVSTFGSWIMITGLIIMIVNLVIARKKGEPAGDNPWGGITLDWQTTSPPPLHNFDKMPELPEGGPYNYPNAKSADGH